MMQDEAPSSMYIQKMFFPIVCTLIYKATWWESLWVPWEESKVIKIEYEGLNPPMEDSKDFWCVG
jgi:hypothetical protein